MLNQKSFSYEKMSEHQLNENIKLLEIKINKVKSPVYKPWDKIHDAAVRCDLTVLEESLQENQTIVNSLSKLSRKHLQNYDWIDTTTIESSYSNTLLLLLLKHAENKDENFIRCIELLVNHNINILHKDSNGVDANSLIQSFVPEIKKQIQEIFQKGNTSESSSPFPFLKNDNEIYEMLDGDEISANMVDGNEDEFSSITLLQWCCRNGHLRSIEKILETVDPNRKITRNGKYPILYLAKNTNITKQELSPFITNLPIDVLPMWMSTRSILKAETDSTNIILKHIENDPNKLQYIRNKDEIGKTALHYAASYGQRKYFKKLLDLGASLIEKDGNGVTPISQVYDPQMLQQYFDTCITTEPNEIMLKDANVKINFNNLMYQKLNNEKIDKFNNPESDFLNSIIDSDRLKHLVEHAVIQIYIFIKWRKLQWIFWFFFGLNAIGTIFVVLYTLNYTNQSTLFRYSLIIGFIFFISEVLLDCYVHRKKTFKRPSTLLTIVVITFICLVWTFDKSDGYLMACMSLVAQLTTLKMFFQLQIHPFFSKRIIILHIVVKNFFKTIFVYSLVIVSFTFSFYLIADEKVSYWYTLYTSTLALGGQSDKELINPFNNNLVYGHCVHLMFVLIIGTLLPNLLIGLTISDINSVENQALSKELTIIARYVVYFENLVNGLRANKNLKFLKNPNIFNSDNFVITIHPNRRKNVSFNSGKRENYKIERASKRLIKHIKEKGRI